MTAHKIIKIQGCLYIIMGVLLNPWLLEHLCAAHSILNETLSRAIIGLFDAVLIGLGILSFKKTKSEFITNISLALWTTVIVIPLLGEMLIRIGIAMNIRQIKNPALYADSSSDDDYWKLLHDWQGRRCGQNRIHPLLGHSQDSVTLDNPLGLRPDTKNRLESPNPKIFFYGDSFVRGSSSEEFKIPNYINRNIKGQDIVDFSVGGYGLDQVYLMFKETYRKAEHPTILVGILVSDDMDRTVLTIRTCQKPYFGVDENGTLQLNGVPIENDSSKYFDTLYTAIYSYFIALIEQQLVLVSGNKKILLKQEISSKILEAFKADADQARVRLVFVLFYGERHLTETDWRETFLKAKLAQLKLPYIDTKEILLEYAHDQHVGLSVFYFQEDGHHNELGNEVISKGIIKYFFKS